MLIVDFEYDIQSYKAFGHKPEALFSHILYIQLNNIILCACTDNTNGKAYIFVVVNNLMASIVTKRISGKEYLYLVASMRKGDRVIQKTVKYIGPKKACSGRRVQMHGNVI